MAYAIIGIILLIFGLWIIIPRTDKLIELLEPGFVDYILSVFGFTLLIRSYAVEIVGFILAVGGIYLILYRRY